MLEGFRAQTFQVGGGVKIHGLVGGSGPGLLLLHGYPQTHVCWHNVAPALTDRFTVVLTDLRGYGASSKPVGDDDHQNYSKRFMAADQVAVMRQLGFETFRVIGHDRGGRVAHRMALDHMDVVERLAVIDIAPTETMYGATDRAFAEAYYHWFFLIQPGGLPERLIGGDPGFYLSHTLASWCKTDGAITQEAFTAYVRAFCDPSSIHAACEDYRAAATIDLVHDAEDTAAQKKITAPLWAVWGERGIVGRRFDVLATWREKSASTVEGMALKCGHFVPEEDPKGLLNALEGFLAR